MLRKILWLSHWGSQKVASDKEQPSQWLLGMTWWSMSYAAGKSLAAPSTPFARNAAQWRAQFNEALQALNLGEYGFRPYSLRRGGATFWFSRHHSLDKILLQGRWQAAKTARIYINEGLSILAEMSLPPSHPSLRPFLSVFSLCIHSSHFLPHLSLLFQEVQGAVERGKPKDPRMDLGSVQSAQIYGDGWMRTPFGMNGSRKRFKALKIR